MIWPVVRLDFEPATVNLVSGWNDCIIQEQLPAQKTTNTINILQQSSCCPGGVDTDDSGLNCDVHRVGVVHGVVCSAGTTTAPATTAACRTHGFEREGDSGTCNVKADEGSSVLLSSSFSDGVIIQGQLTMVDG